MLGNSTLTIVNHVNELHLQTQVKGDLDASAYTILTSVVAAESTAKVLTFSRDAGIHNGKQYTILTSFSIASLPMQVEVTLEGTLTDSNMWVRGQIGSESTPGFSDVASQTVHGTLEAGDTALGYSLTVDRQSAFLGHDDVVVSIAPTGQDAGRNHVLMDWRKAEFFSLLDVWGEGRIVTTDRPPVATGFRQAYNVNKVDQTISNGPDKGKPIPNQIPVADWGGSNFGGVHPLEAVMPSDSVIFMTVMGSPLVPTTASEMVRVLDPVKGIVFLYNVSAKGISAFEAACPAGLRLKQVVTDPSELGTPFCEVRGSYFPVRIYGWQGHADHYEFHTDL